MKAPSYNLQRVQEGYSRIANASLRASAPEAGGAPAKVTAEEVRTLFTAARGSDKRMSVDEKVRLASEWGALKGRADAGALAEFKKLGARLNLPSPERLQGIRDSLRLKWGPQVDSPAPQLTVKQLQDAVAAGRNEKGQLDDASKFLLAYEFQAIPERSKSLEVKQEYARLQKELGLPLFTDGRRTDSKDLGVG